MHPGHRNEKTFMGEAKRSPIRARYGVLPTIREHGDCRALRWIVVCCPDQFRPYGLEFRAQLSYSRARDIVSPFAFEVSYLLENLESATAPVLDIAACNGKSGHNEILVNGAGNGHEWWTLLNQFS